MVASRTTTTAAAGPPGAPTNLAVTFGETSWVTWDPPVSGGVVDSYHVQVDATARSADSRSTWTWEPLGYMITYVILNVGDEFSVRVHARNTAGDSPWTEFRHDDHGHHRYDKRFALTGIATPKPVSNGRANPHCGCVEVGLPERASTQPLREATEYMC